MLYVDDLLICYNEEDEANEIKMKLAKEFEMKALGKVNRFMGLEIVHNDDELTIHQ